MEESKTNQKELYRFKYDNKEECFIYAYSEKLRDIELEPLISLIEKSSDSSRMLYSVEGGFITVEVCGLTVIVTHTDVVNDATTELVHLIFTTNEDIKTKNKVLLEVLRDHVSD